MKKFFLFLTCLFFSFLFAFSSRAYSSNIVINEITWMGTEISYNDEWIELYNNTNKAINLEGWVLKAEDKTPEINLAGGIPAFSFYILERTDDDTLPDVSADQIYTGSLSNSGEDLQLLDNSGDLIDSINCSSGWFAGNNKTKQTMERKDSKSSGSDPEDWQNSLNTGGTPKVKNSKQETVNNKQLTPAENDSLPPQSKKTPIVYPSNIFINEILPSPEGPDAEEEWIEIFNKNDFEVDISGWQIKDIIGRTKTYIFSEETKISAKGFLVFKRPITKITLNNDGDGLLFIQPDGKIIDKTNYDKASHNQSYSKTESGWIWNSNLTPGSSNITPALILETEEETEKEKTQKSIQKKGLATISKQIPENISSFFPILIASAISIFSGIIILVLKKNLTKTERVES